MLRRLPPFLPTLALTALAALMLPACEVSPPDTTAEAQLSDEVQLTLRQFMRQDPTLEREIEDAYGYAVFPSVGKGGALLAGASWGRGAVYEQGNLVGYATVSSATLGPQAGGQSIRQMILFQNQDAFDRFLNEQVTVGGDINAVALQPGAAQATNFTNGVKVLTQTQGGLMAEASLGVQNFEFSALRDGAPTGAPGVFGTTPQEGVYGTTPTQLEQQQQQLQQEEEQQRTRQFEQERRDLQRRQQQIQQRMQNLEQREQELQRQQQFQQQQGQQSQQQPGQPGVQDQQFQQQQPGQQGQQFGQPTQEQQLQQLRQQRRQLEQQIQQLEQRQQQIEQQIEQFQQQPQQEGPWMDDAEQDIEP